MKNYKTLVESLPPKTIVFAFGRFNPPTSGHELLVKAVKKLAIMNKANYVIYASYTQNSKKDPLSLDKKLHYLNLLFPSTNFVGASKSIPSFIQAVKELNKKYKNLIMVAGSDRVAEYKQILEKYNGKEFNYDSIQVISAGERDPDSDSASGMSATKMRTAASKGDYISFKKGLPSHVRDIDAKLLMNDIRIGLNLEPIKEQIKLEVDDIREQYFRGEIFKIGELVESNNKVYTILKRGSNHVLVEDIEGNKTSKWITDVNQIKQEDAMIDEELTNKTIKPNDKIKVARMIADFLGYDGAEKSSNPTQLVNQALRKVKSKLIHTDSINILQKMLKLADDVGIKYDQSALPAKLKEAKEPRVVEIDKKSKRNAAGDIMSYKDFKKSLDMNKGVSEDMWSADYKVNPETGRKSRAHRINFKNSGIKDKLEPENVKESLDSDNMDDVEDLLIMNPDGTIETLKGWDHRKVGHSLGSDDTDQLRRMKVKYKTEEVEIDFKKEKKKNQNPTSPVKDDGQQVGANNSKGFDAFFEEEDFDMSEDDLEKLANNLTDDDYLDAYDDDELAIVDDETGEIINDSLKEEVEELNEVLSRAERIKARIRFARTKAKRERKIRIALKRHSDSKTINRRARKLAIKTLKQRLAKKPINKMSVGEKERIERLVAKRKKLIDRLAMKLVPKVRRVEQDRLAHSKVTQ